MKITEALRIDEQSSVAIVGAGGKTSLMFALAAAAERPVCLTTTTKLARDEGLRVSNHQFPEEDQTWAEADYGKAGVRLVTGALNRDGEKWLGLSTLEIARLAQACRESGELLLIEADGARRLSLKAPGDHEPVIPEFVSLVIVVVGLSTIGSPLDERHVFRPERFHALTGLPMGEAIRLEHILRMLADPNGGLKDVPRGCERAVVFNQADAFAMDSNERASVVEVLSESYQTAILTAMRSDQANCEVIFRR